MQFYSFLIVLTIFWAFTVGAEKVEGPEKEISCSADELKNFDKTVARIISFTKEQRAFPETREGIAPYCAGFKKDHSILEASIKKCLKGAARNFGQVLVYSFGAIVRGNCNPKNKRRNQEIIITAKCANIEKVRSQAEVLLQKYTFALKHGAVAKPNKNRIGYACCHYFKLLSELETILRQHCTAKQVDATLNLVRNIVQSFVDVACLNFTDSSDACDHLPAPPKEMYASMFPNSTSFVVPLIELFANLDN